MNIKHMLPMVAAMLIGNIYADTILHRGNEFEPATLDPQLATDNAGFNILLDTFEGLTSMDASGNVVPGVAERWETSEDGKTWTFYLRKNAKWSNGEPVTSGDFVYAWRRAVDPKTASSYSNTLFPIKNAQAIVNGAQPIENLGIEAIDDHTLRVTLESPTPYLLELLYLPVTFPVPQSQIEQYGNAWTQPEHVISNGPFILSKVIPQASITINKSDTYWDQANVKLDGVVYYPVENGNAGVMRYRAGELDLVDVPQEQLNWAKATIPDELKIYSILGTYYFGFNQTQAPFKDNPALRAALSMAIDRDVLIEKIARGGQEPAFSMVPAHTARHKDYRPTWSTWPRDKQIAEAQKRYAEAGYSKDKPLKISLIYNTSDDQKQNAIAIAGMWKQVLGVETTITNKEWKVMLADVKAKGKDVQVYRMGWSADYNDPNTFLEIFRSDSGNNYTGFADPEYDALLDRAATETDQTHRSELLYEAEKRLAENHAIMPIFFKNRTLLLKPNVTGFEENPVNFILSRHLGKK